MGPTINYVRFDEKGIHSHSKGPVLLTNSATVMSVVGGIGVVALAMPSVSTMDMSGFEMGEFEMGDFEVDAVQTEPVRVLSAAEKQVLQEQCAANLAAVGEAIIAYQ